MHCSSATAQAKHNISGWKDIGITVGKAIYRERVLVERKHEVFRKVLSKEELSLAEPESILMMPRPQGYVLRLLVELAGR